MEVIKEKKKEKKVIASIIQTHKKVRKNFQPACLWNLPTLSGFKTQLKSFLFWQAFSQDRPFLWAQVVFIYVYTCVNGMW